MVLVIMSGVLLLFGCDVGVWNNPYNDNLGDNTEKVVYGSFSEKPKHLDPAVSYSANEAVMIGQIYEPPLQYHYLKRPYTLIPNSAASMPDVAYLDAQKQVVSDKNQAKFTRYTITLRDDVRYQPHPALAKDEQGAYRYHRLSQENLDGVNTLYDFEHTGSRLATADDYIYQIKRLADPEVLSPVNNILAEYIVGFKTFGEQLTQLRQDRRNKKVDIQKDKVQKEALDLRNVILSGVTRLDDKRFQITVNGDYPQFKYWLAMTFFAPVPWEADAFYQQAGMNERNLTLDWYPIGTGPFMMSENNPNLRMVLSRNPHYHGSVYPSEGMPDDVAAGLLKDKGKPLPLIDKAIYSLEKESIPYWNKFLQGYYDYSGITSDSFDQAVQLSAGEFNLTPEMQEKGIKLTTSVGTTLYYTGFNMLDPVVGGYSTQKKKLRQAISIAMDFEQYISIFTNGRAQAAQGPLPAGIFGHLEGEAGINSVVYEWKNNQAVRRPIERAKQLLAEAGYPNGIDPKTGKPLVLYLDTTGFGASAKAFLQWKVKQYAKLGIELVPRGTDYNRFQDKVKKATTQIFEFGWGADYPDPENFLFLFYGPNSSTVSQGMNATNYQNPRYDRLFETMRTMPDGDERQAIINEMVSILRHDAPWMFGIVPKSFALSHQWYQNQKPNYMARNVLKYKNVDVALRKNAIKTWNSPMLWPIALLGLGIVLVLLLGVWRYRQQELKVGR